MKAVNPCGLKRAALINDLSCFGKCSLSVSMPILSSYGIETVPLPTALLSTHTGGFTGYVEAGTGHSDIGRKYTAPRCPRVMTRAATAQTIKSAAKPPVRISRFFCAVTKSSA